MQEPIREIGSFRSFLASRIQSRRIGNSNQGHEIRDRIPAAGALRQKRRIVGFIPVAAAAMSMRSSVLT
jgi:hypothetical protein